MERIQYICDVCGEEKRDANHWWTLNVNQFGFHFGPMEYGSSDPQKQHICGQDCAVRKLAEFMSRFVPVASTNPTPAPAASADTSTAAESGSQPILSQPQWTEKGPITEETTK